MDEIPSLGFAKALDLYISSTQARDTYWNLYVIVAIGIVGFVLSRKERPSVLLCLGLAVTFAAFAAGNLSALLNQHALQEALAYQVVDAEGSVENLTPQLREKTSKVATAPLTNPSKGLHSPDWRKLGIFHFVLDVIVIFVILAPVFSSILSMIIKPLRTDFDKELSQLQVGIRALDKGLVRVREQLEDLSNRT